MAAIEQRETTSLIGSDKVEGTAVYGSDEKRIGSIDRVIDTLVKAGASVRATALVGSHATRYRVSAEGARPVPTGR